MRWRGGRAVECGGLENRLGFTPYVSSNLTLSASVLYKRIIIKGMRNKIICQWHILRDFNNLKYLSSPNMRL